jgi:hypothetical protein
MTGRQTGDIQKACRHLLRHLEDPAALASNELVAPIFRRAADAALNRRNSQRTLASVRRLLRSAASDLLARGGGPAAEGAMREHQILMRCDLNGEPHKRVAADLGLSMRQFYRERSMMIDHLAEILFERLAAVGSGSACAIDITALELARARALQYGGYSDWAIVLLRSITESSEDDGAVVAAGCQLASLLIDHNELEHARRELDELENYLAQRHRPDPDGLNRARIALERRNLLWSSGSDLEARHLDEREAPELARIARTGYRPAQEFVVNALSYSGRREFMAGHFAPAREICESARDLLALREHTRIDLQIVLLVLYGVLLATTREERAATSIAFLDATTLAVRHGLSELAIVAAVGLSIDDQMRGDERMAMERVREVVPLAESVASPVNYAHLHLRIAELEIGAGNISAARESITEAEHHLVVGSYGWTYKELLSAYVSLAARDFLAAKASAEIVAASAAKQQNDRVEGSALRALAESYIGLNARSAAIAVIEAAIVKLENAGYPLVLAAAYRTAAKLTGREKYVRAANEFASLLSPA